MATHGVTDFWTRSHGPFQAEPLPSDLIDYVLRNYTAVAVVGVSSKLSRPSHGVAEYLRTHGYRVIPVNPNEKSVFREHCYAALDEIPETVEIVVIFRRPEFVPQVVESAIRKGAKVIWMQEGITHEAAATRAREAGLAVVEDRCILKEHAKRFVADGI